MSGRRSPPVPRPAETAAAQLRRLLDLVPRLADGEEHAIDEVAAREGIAPRQVVGDIGLLAARVGDPGGFVEGVQATIEPERVWLTTAHFRRPMRLTPAELAALDLGLAMLRAERLPPEQAAVDAARALLRRVQAGLARAGAPGAAMQEVDVAGGQRWGAAPAGDVAVLSAVRDALRARRPVSMRYRKAAAGGAEPRVVRPYALAAVRGAWYLVGHCEARNGAPVFRLDRVEAVAGGTGRYAVPTEFSLDTLLGDGRMFAEPPGTEALRVRYSARIARWIAERERGAFEWNGAYVVEHRMADTEWAIRHVLQYGPDAEVLAPADVRSAVAARLDAMLWADRSAAAEQAARQSG